MKIVPILTNRWKPKLACLFLAIGLWYVIQQSVPQSTRPAPWPDPAAATQAR